MYIDLRCGFSGFQQPTIDAPKGFCPIAKAQGINVLQNVTIIGCESSENPRWGTRFAWIALRTRTPIRSARLVTGPLLVFNRRVSVPLHRRLVLISGLPAAGKSTIAQPLANALGFALLTKDDVKESLFTTLSAASTPIPAGAAEFSRLLSSAAFDLLWSLAARCPRLILEANFQTKSPRVREKFSALLAQPGIQAVEVHCRVPLEEAARRFAGRALLGRHPAHTLHVLSLDRLAPCAEPFAMCPVIEVDTTQPVDLEVLVAGIRRILASPQSAL